MNRDRQKKIAAETLKELGDEIICSRCNATAATYHKCPADLSDACPGFIRYDKIRSKWERTIKP